MTLTRQRRHKARARAAAEPYRQAAIIRALEAARDAGARVLIMGAHGSFGVPTEFEVGRRVWLSTADPPCLEAEGGLGTNVPWRMIEGVEPWA